MVDPKVVPIISPPPAEAFEENRPKQRGADQRKLNKVYLRKKRTAKQQHVQIQIPALVMEAAFGKDWHSFRYDWRRGKAPHDAWLRVYLVDKGLKPQHSQLSVTCASIFNVMQLADGQYEVEFHPKQNELYLHLTGPLARALTKG